jgi:hypothetical protein
MIKKHPDPNKYPYQIPNVIIKHSIIGMKMERIIKRKAQNGWFPTRFENLKKGDIIKIFDNEEIYTHNGMTEMIALNDPYFNDENILKIDLEWIENGY